MDDEDRYLVWSRDAQLLAKVGQHLFGQPTRVRVRLPRSMAAEALAAWEREADEQPLPAESARQREVRHQAGTLGLIGLCVQNAGVEDGDDVIVEIDSWYVGLALEAADEAGLLQGVSPPPRGPDVTPPNSV